jgi:hypothetical protein
VLDEDDQSYAFMGAPGLSFNHLAISTAKLAEACTG